MHGKFISMNDSSGLIVSENLITRIYELKATTGNLDVKIDSTLNIKINNGSITLDSTEYPASKNEDKVGIAIHIKDTLFSIANGGIIKKHKGFYFLNEQRTNGTWEVHKVAINRNGAVISTIAKDADFDQLSEITEEDGPAPHTFSPTKNEFKKFVKSGGFAKEEEFIRTK